MTYSFDDFRSLLDAVIADIGEFVESDLIAESVCRSLGIPFRVPYAGALELSTDGRPFRGGPTRHTSAVAIVKSTYKPGGHISRLGIRWV